MAYRALKDKFPHFKAGDVVEINEKYTKDLLKKRIIAPMDFDATQEFFVEQAATQAEKEIANDQL